MLNRLQPVTTLSGLSRLTQPSEVPMMQSFAPRLNTHSGSLYMHTARQIHPHEPLHEHSPHGPAPVTAQCLQFRGCICKDTRLQAILAETTYARQAAADRDSQSNQVLN